MSEEKKKERKMKYEIPRLVRIGDVTAKGDCWNGSGDTSDCNIGNAASPDCPQGNGVITVD
ncbi:MAG TPA: hypothetical protein ACFYD6_01050 [Candidatus Brocadiia bacterium]|nr:hypothetical protein [Candidatus Brocadiales bacterium]